MGRDSIDLGEAGRAHRRAERITFTKRTVIHLASSDGSFTDLVIQICDFSPVGVGLTADVPMRRGQQFTMRLSSDGAQAQEMLYSIAYCRPTEDGRFQVGAEFICVASEQDSSSRLSDAQSIARIRRSILS